MMILKKARGSRAARIIYEEIGRFPKFQVAWTTNEPSVREGKETWGQQIGIGCVWLELKFIIKKGN